MDVGKRIQSFRLKKGLTVNRLANLAGVSQSYLRDLELGKKQPTVEYLSYICDALGVSLATFFDDTVPKDELLVEIQKLNDDQRLALYHFLQSINNKNT